MEKKNVLIGLFIGRLMRRGRRVSAEKIMLNCLKELKVIHKIENPLEVLLVVLDKISPLIEMKSRKVGGTVYRIPMDISLRRGATLGIKILMESVGEKTGLSLSNRIVKEVLLAYSGEGKAVERVREIYEFAKKNRGLVKFI